MKASRNDRRVLVAMSGGVDSSVAAWMLQQAGYECIGVFMRVGTPAPASQECALDGPRRFRHGCCSASDAIDARAVAGRLGIPFYALNFEPDFQRIIDGFVREYAAGRTPNPCIRCNIEIKFGRLLEYADLLGARWVATGHYARLLRTGGQTRLARAANRAKDQSYVLFGIRRELLERCLFPLGDVPDKRQVREIAQQLGLRVHDKPDSQEICFVPDGDYRRLLRERAPKALRPGPIVDASGRVLGRHEGLGAYTVGQRRGLGIATGVPLYVLRLDVARNTLIVGTKQQVRSRHLTARDVNWLVDPPDRPTRVQVRIRHMHPPADATLRVGPDGCVRVEFDEPQEAVTPGQAAVFYQGEIVLGGGWIAQTPPEDEERTGGEQPPGLSAERPDRGTAGLARPQSV